jgi:hypothetical protein
MKFLVAQVVCDALDTIKDQEKRKQDKLLIIQNLRILLKRVERECWFIEIVPGILSTSTRIILGENFLKVKLQMFLLMQEIIKTENVYGKYYREILQIIKIFRKKLPSDLQEEFKKLLFLATELEHQRLDSQGLGLEEGLLFLIRSIARLGQEEHLTLSSLLGGTR